MTDLLERPPRKSRTTQKIERIYNVEEEEPKEVALRIHKINRKQKTDQETQLDKTDAPPNEGHSNMEEDEQKSCDEMDYETESNSSSASSDVPPRRPSFIRYRYIKRRERFLRMAKNIFHINSMQEFCNSAKIKDEKLLIKKYEQLLVNIESGCSEFAKKKHDSRLLKKQLQRVQYELMHMDVESDGSAMGDI